MAKTRRAGGQDQTAVIEAAAAAARRQKPSEDKLRRLRETVAQARDLELQIRNTMERLAELNDQLAKIENDTLPTMFQELGVTSMSLDTDGNHPAFVAELDTVYKANLPKDDRAQKAYKKFPWLREMAKTRVEISFGRDEQARVKKLEAVLKKMRVPFDKELSVHWKTLTSEVRRRFEDGKPLPPADLDLLGAFVMTRVKLTEQKEKK